MRRFVRTVILAAASLGPAGCVTRPLIDNPALVRADPAFTCANPSEFLSALNPATLGTMETGER